MRLREEGRSKLIDEARCREYVETYPGITAAPGAGLPEGEARWFFQQLVRRHSSRAQHTLQAIGHDTETPWAPMR